MICARREGKVVCSPLRRSWIARVAMEEGKLLGWEERAWLRAVWILGGRCC
jgi:hypothetical protein